MHPSVAEATYCAGPRIHFQGYFLHHIHWSYPFMWCREVGKKIAGFLLEQHQRVNGIMLGKLSLNDTDLVLKGPQLQSQLRLSFCDVYNMPPFLTCKTQEWESVVTDLLTSNFINSCIYTWSQVLQRLPLWITNSLLSFTEYMCVWVYECIFGMYLLDIHISSIYTHIYTHTYWKEFEGRRDSIFGWYIIYIRKI